MAKDYYSTLGISRTASPDEIQKAYRKLARKYHPDMNPDDATAKKKFQEVQIIARALDLAESSVRGAGGVQTSGNINGDGGVLLGT